METDEWLLDRGQGIGYCGHKETFWLWHTHLYSADGFVVYASKLYTLNRYIISALGSSDSHPLVTPLPRRLTPSGIRGHLHLNALTHTER